MVVCYELQLILDDDVAGLFALGAIFNGKFYGLAFDQVPVAIALNCGKMNEYILAAFALDEAVAFAAVEPFDCTDGTI